MRQSACLFVSPITVDSYGFLFDCTTVGQAYFESGTVVQEEMSFKLLLSEALAALLFSGTEPFMQFL